MGGEQRTGKSSGLRSPLLGSGHSGGRIIWDGTEKVLVGLEKGICVSLGGQIAGIAEPWLWELMLSCLDYQVHAAG